MPAQRSIDGALNVEQSFLRLLPAPSPDAVQEFTIQTSVPSAKYAYSGGVIEIATKSGTNELHGTAYEFLRNDALDARNFFSPTKTKRRRNQYGVAAGGPVRFPGYDGRNRTFWFFNFEQQKERLGAVTTTFVPTPRNSRATFRGWAGPSAIPSRIRTFPAPSFPSPSGPAGAKLHEGIRARVRRPDGNAILPGARHNNPTKVLARGDHSMGANQFSFRSFVTRLKNPSPTATCLISPISTRSIKATSTLLHTRAS